MKRNILATLVLVVSLSVINVYADNNAKDYIDSGIDKHMNGDYSVAIQDYNKAIELDPKSEMLTPIEDVQKMF